MASDCEALTVDQYVRAASRTDQLRATGTVGFAMLGLFGGTGSLLAVAKKKQRDALSHPGYAEAVLEEIGDVLWYFAAIARRFRFELSDLAAAALVPGGVYREGGNSGLTLHALQAAQMETVDQPAPNFESSLLRLASAFALLSSELEAGTREVSRATVAEHLVTAMRCLVHAANDLGVTLEAAAIKNLGKIFDRWRGERGYPEPFDANMDPEEQLPRTMQIDIYERTVRDQVHVFQRSNGVFVGDRFSDDAVEGDDYRFHDVLHYAHVAVLGWSPVLRAQLRLKRRSDPKLDEVEDGARAVLIERGVTSWLFGQAQQLDFFDGVQRGGLPLDILKHVRQSVAGYEVERCPLWLWEEAILEGYKAFRFLQKHRRARISIDFPRRRLLIKGLG